MAYKFNPFTGTFDDIGDTGIVIQELATDPASPTPGQTWVLRTNENPANTLQAFIGGFPATTALDDNKYELSFRTALGTTVRTLLT